MLSPRASSSAGAGIEAFAPDLSALAAEARKPDSVLPGWLANVAAAGRGVSASTAAGIAVAEKAELALNALDSLGEATDDSHAQAEETAIQVRERRWWRRGKENEKTNQSRPSMEQKNPTSLSLSLSLNKKLLPNQAVLDAFLAAATSHPPAPTRVAAAGIAGIVRLAAAATAAGGRPHFLPPGPDAAGAALNAVCAAADCPTVDDSVRLRCLQAVAVLSQVGPVADAPGGVGALLGAAGRVLAAASSSSSAAAAAGAAGANAGGSGTKSVGAAIISAATGGEVGGATGGGGAAAGGSGPSASNRPLSATAAATVRQVVAVAFERAAASPPGPPRGPRRSPCCLTCARWPRAAAEEETPRLPPLPLPPRAPRSPPRRRAGPAAGRRPRAPSASPCSTSRSPPAGPSWPRPIRGSRRLSGRR